MSQLDNNQRPQTQLPSQTHHHASTYSQTQLNSQPNRSLYMKKPKMITIITDDQQSEHIQRLLYQIKNEQIPKHLQKDKYQLQVLPEQQMQIRFVVVDNIKGSINLGPQFTAPLMMVIGYPLIGKNQSTRYFQYAQQVVQFFKTCRATHNAFSQKSSVRMKQVQLATSQKLCSIRLKTINVINLRQIQERFPDKNAIKDNNHQHNNNSNSNNNNNNNNSPSSSSAKKLKSRKNIHNAKRLLIFHSQGQTQEYKKFIKSFLQEYPDISKVSKLKQIKGLCRQGSLCQNYILISSKKVDQAISINHQNFQMIVYCQSQSQCLKSCKKQKVICASSNKADLMCFIQRFGFSGIRRKLKTLNKSKSKKKKLVWAQDKQYQGKFQQGSIFQGTVQPSINVRIKKNQSNLNSQSLLLQSAIGIGGTANSFLRNHNNTNNSNSFNFNFNFNQKDSIKNDIVNQQTNINKKQNQRLNGHNHNHNHSNQNSNQIKSNTQSNSNQIQTNINQIMNKINQCYQNKNLTAKNNLALKQKDSIQLKKSNQRLESQKGSINKKFFDNNQNKQEKKYINKNTNNINEQQLQNHQNHQNYQNNIEYALNTFSNIQSQYNIQPHRIISKNNPKNNQTGQQSNQTKIVHLGNNKVTVKHHRQSLFDPHILMKKENKQNRFGGLVGIQQQQYGKVQENLGCSNNGNQNSNYLINSVLKSQNQGSQILYHRQKCKSSKGDFNYKSDFPKESGSCLLTLQQQSQLMKLKKDSNQISKSLLKSKFKENVNLTPDSVTVTATNSELFKSSADSTCKKKSKLKAFKLKSKSQSKDNSVLSKSIQKNQRISIEKSNFKKLTTQNQNQSENQKNNFDDIQFVSIANPHNQYYNYGTCDQFSKGKLNQNKNSYSNNTNNNNKFSATTPASNNQRGHFVHTPPTPITNQSKIIEKPLFKFFSPQKSENPYELQGIINTPRKKQNLSINRSVVNQISLSRVTQKSKQFHEQYYKRNNNIKYKDSIDKSYSDKYSQTPNSRSDIQISVMNHINNDSEYQTFSKNQSHIKMIQSKNFKKSQVSLSNHKGIKIKLEKPKINVQIYKFSQKKIDENQNQNQYQYQYQYESKLFEHSNPKNQKNPYIEEDLSYYAKSIKSSRSNKSYKSSKSNVYFEQSQSSIQMSVSAASVSLTCDYQNHRNKTSTLLKQRVKCPILYLVDDCQSSLIFPLIMKIINKGHRIVTHHSYSQLINQLQSCLMISDITLIFSTFPVDLDQIKYLSDKDINEINDKQNNDPSDIRLTSAFRQAYYSQLQQQKTKKSHINRVFRVQLDQALKQICLPKQHLIRVPKLQFLISFLNNLKQEKKQSIQSKQKQIQRQQQKWNQNQKQKQKFLKDYSNIPLLQNNLTKANKKIILNKPILSQF